MRPQAPARVETSRLVFTAPVAADAREVFERYAGDPEVTLYLGWPTHRSLADTEAFLGFSTSQWARDGMGPYLIRLRENGRLIGSTGLGLEDAGEEKRAVTGYVLAKDAWGLGYATEALGAMVGVARTIGISKLFALCHPEHERSVRVLEKCAFELDRACNRQIVFPNLAPGVLQDVLCYVRAC